MQTSIHVQIETRHAGNVQCRPVDLDGFSRVEVSRTLAIPETISARSFSAQPVPSPLRLVIRLNVMQVVILQDNSVLAVEGRDGVAHLPDHFARAYAQGFRWQIQRGHPINSRVLCQPTAERQYRDAGDEESRGNYGLENSFRGRGGHHFR